MNEKVVVITGASAGIGKESARMLAEKGAHVVMVCRNPVKGESARSKILARIPNAKLDLLYADLSSQKEIRLLAEKLNQSYTKIDVLLNNAGALINDRQLSVDGIELTFATNHLSYFLLTKLLLEKLKQSSARIINVASEAHRGASINFDDINQEKSYLGFRVYGESKLANILFTYELAQRLAGSGATTNCLHPGVVNTEFFRFLGILGKVGGLFFKTPEEGAKTSVYLASSPEVAFITGKYFDDCKEKQSSGESYKDGVAKQLWELSERLTKSTE